MATNQNVFTKSFIHALLIALHFGWAFSLFDNEQVPNILYMDFLLVLIKFIVCNLFYLHLVYVSENTDKTKLCASYRDVTMITLITFVITIMRITIACELIISTGRKFFIVSSLVTLTEVFVVMTFGCVVCTEPCQCSKCLKRLTVGQQEYLAQEILRRNKKVVACIEHRMLKAKMEEMLRCTICELGMNLFCCRECVKGFCYDCHQNLRKRDLYKNCPFCRTENDTYEFISLPRMS